MTLGTFAGILSMRRDGVYVENIADLAGLARTNAPMAFFLAAMMFSLAGIPPLAGFFAKFYVFAAAIEADLYGARRHRRAAQRRSPPITICASSRSCISTSRPRRSTDRRRRARVVLALSTALVIFYALAPAPLTDAAMAAAKSLF